MTYRDGFEAARARQDSLVRELEEVRAGLADRDALAARERALVAAIAEVSSNVEHLRARVELPLLQQIEVASPCNERWDAMIGDGRARECRRCERTVYDLSAMSAAEAEALLESRADMCVRFYRRADGTVMTTDCPDGARRKRRRRLLVVAVAVAGLGAAGGSLVQFVTREVDPVGTRQAVPREVQVPQDPGRYTMGGSMGVKTNHEGTGQVRPPPTIYEDFNNVDDMH